MCFSVYFTDGSTDFWVILFAPIIVALPSLNTVHRWMLFSGVSCSVLITLLIIHSNDHESADSGAARSKGWVCCRSLAGIVGSNPTKGMDVSLVSVVCCQVEVPATGRSLVQRNTTLCVCVSLSDQVRR